jgi:hypothetical protein
LPVVLDVRVDVFTNTLNSGNMDDMIYPVDMLKIIFQKGKRLDPSR